MSLSFATNLLGSGAGIAAFVVGALLMRYHTVLPGQTHPWARRIAVVLFYAGGACLAVTTIGLTADRVLRWALRHADVLGAGAAQAILAAAVLIVLVTAVLGLIFTPDRSIAVLAASLPVLLALTTTGFLHNVDLALNTPAIHAATALNAAIGG